MIKKNTKMKNAEHLRKICQWKQSEFTALFGRRCGSKQHLRFHSEGKEWHRRVGSGRIAVKMPKEKDSHENSTIKTQNRNKLPVGSTELTNRTFASFSRT